MKTIQKQKFYVFDNQGASFDRYTIIFKDGMILASSENPFSPLGFGQHCGEIKEPLTVYLSEARKNIEWLGIEITDFTQLPKDVLTFITDNL